MAIFFFDKCYYRLEKMNHMSHTPHLSALERIAVYQSKIYVQAVWAAPNTKPTEHSGAISLFDYFNTNVFPASQTILIAYSLHIFNHGSTCWYMSPVCYRQSSLGVLMRTSGPNQGSRMRDHRDRGALFNAEKQAYSHQIGLCVISAVRIGI